MTLIKQQLGAAMPQEKCPLCQGVYEDNNGIAVCPNGCSSKKGDVYLEKREDVVKIHWTGCPVCYTPQCSDIEVCRFHNEYGEVFTEYFPVHTLKDGTRIAITSRHGFKFSDGTEYVPALFAGAVEMPWTDIRVESSSTWGELPCGAKVSRRELYLPFDSQSILESLEDSDIDIILVSFQLLEAARGRNFKKVVAFNSTAETARLRPSEKIVDLNNWAW